MSDELLSIMEIASLYKTSAGAIRTAIWRAKHGGSDPGFPMPSIVRGSYRWLKSDVEKHLQTLSSGVQVPTSSTGPIP